MQTVLTDSLEKVLGDDAPRPAAPIAGVHASGFLGEVLSLQLALHLAPEDPADLHIHLTGDVAEDACVHAVRRVPVSSPAPEDPDEHYLVTTPGEYPDLLEPLPDGIVRVERGIWEALWIDVAEAAPGDHTLTVALSDAAGKVLAEEVLRLRVHPHRLPPLTITNTHWFHADSLSTYYELEVFSERHWELIEAFLASAREMDVTSVLTPVWTPPLDTAEGHTRPFVQLVGIREEGGECSFDLSRLDRWLRLCRELGFTGLEIAHLFTQWGAQNTPAIQVETADGLEHRFGWHVPATDPEYRRLLEALIPALRTHLEAHWGGQVLWHISDEPHEAHLESYRAAKAQVEDLLAGADVVDALSSLAFAEQGVVDTPIVATNHVGPFLEAGGARGSTTASPRTGTSPIASSPCPRCAIGCWVGSCSRTTPPASCTGASTSGGRSSRCGRSIPSRTPARAVPSSAATPSSSTRGPDGTPWLSVRHRVFAQAMADHRALTWLAELTDRPSATALIDEGGTLTYSSFSYDVEEHLRARAAVDGRILAALEG